MRSIIITILLITTIIGIAVCSEEDDDESSSKQQYVLNLPFTITGLQETNNDKERLARLEEKMDDILTIVKNDNISSTCNCEQRTPRSCEELRATQPNASSGYYFILTETGNHRKVYCDMSELCGDSKGWVRMGYLNMSEQIRCPQGFEFSKTNNINTCGKPVDHGCQSIKFPSNSISYTKVCGMVTGYQKGLVYALWSRSSSNNINQDYVDGVSITRGSPRKHMWTFMAATHDGKDAGAGGCPCTNNDKVPTPPSFVGDDYFCESGNPSSDVRNTVVHTADLLWDGEKCGQFENGCCEASSMPWFNRELNEPTTDYIELRLCNHWSNYGDTLLGSYAIYVK